MQKDDTTLDVGSHTRSRGPCRQPSADPDELRIKMELWRRLALQLEDTLMGLLQLEGLTVVDAVDIAAIANGDVRLFSGVDDHEAASSHRHGRRHRGLRHLGPVIYNFLVISNCHAPGSR